MTQPGSPGNGDGADRAADREAAARRRRGALLNHFIAYFAAMIVLIPVNFLTTPGYAWFVFPLVLWGAPLAVHTAYAMGLFDGWRRGG